MTEAMRSAGLGRAALRSVTFGPIELRLVPASHPTADLEIFAAIAGACAIAALLFLPLDAIALLAGGCRFKTTTGLPCMTCGATRAMIALSHLEILAALRYQPIVTTLALGGIVFTPFAWGSWLMRLPRLRVSASSGRVVFWIVGGVVATVLINWAFLIADGR